MKEGTYLDSELWLDQADGAEAIDRRVERKTLSAEEAQPLREFVADGYLRFQLPDSDASIETLLSDVDRIWESRPVDLAYRFVGEPCSMADAVQRRERMAPCRLLNIHGHSSAALDLYLNRRIFDWVELILDRKAVAFESVFTEFGRSEAPYRDVVYFDVDPPSHLLTAWVALEDIRMESGPIYTVAGSHRLPLFEFGAGRFRIRADEDYLPARRFAAARAGEEGLREDDLTLRKGEVAIWHPAIIHGARRVLQPWVTRRSFMIRFSSLGSMKSRRASYWKNVRGRLWRQEKRLYWNETERLLERNGCSGFDDPLRGMDPRGLTVLEKIRSTLGRT